MRRGNPVDEAQHPRSSLDHRVDLLVQVRQEAIREARWRLQPQLREQRHEWAHEGAEVTIARLVLVTGRQPQVQGERPAGGSAQLVDGASDTSGVIFVEAVRAQSTRDAHHRRELHRGQAAERPEDDGNVDSENLLEAPGHRAP